MNSKQERLLTEVYVNMKGQNYRNVKGRDE